MPERPLIIMPEAESVNRLRGRGGGGSIPSPALTERRKRTFDEKFKVAYNYIQSVSAGIVPEMTLVIITVGEIRNFKNAVEAIPGLEWLAEVAQDEIEGLDDLYPDKANRDKARKKGGRLYLVSSNKSGLDKIISLWNNHKNNKQLERKHRAWEKVFEYIAELRYWNAKDRVLESGALKYWKEDVEVKSEFVNAKVFFDIEMHFRKDDKIAADSVKKIAEMLGEINGDFLSRARINAIGFDALKISCPVSSIKDIVQNWDSENAGEIPRIINCDAVKFFRPIPQQLSEGVDTVAHSEETMVAPPTKTHPVIALLDGHPWATHDFLSNYLIVEDPDNFQKLYEPGQMLHGTSMASLICHDDIGNPKRQSLSAPIYTRPIMAPDKFYGRERIPADRFPEDLVETSVKRMLDETNGVAQSVRFINLSIGNIDIHFFGELSHWARLLDWLSWKYKVLFVVSVGNYSERIKFSAGGDSFLEQTLKEMANSIRNRKILSPAESINSITVGAVNADYSSVPKNDSRVDVMDEERLMAEYSRLGGGHRGAIKPEIVVAGGRQMYTKQLDDAESLWVKPDTSSDVPGQRFAAIGRLPEEKNYVAYGRGTSNAAALTTHAAGLIYDVIDELRTDANHAIDEKYDSLLIKSLLVHGASWRGMRLHLDVLKNSANSQQFKRYIAKYLGYGEPDFSRVMECTSNRVTALGFGDITMDKSHQFRLPMPLVGMGMHYTLIVTLSYFTPIAPLHLNYRKAKLFFKCLLPNLNRRDAHGDHVHKGTVQHEIFNLKKFDEEAINIVVQCNTDATSHLDEPIPYALAITLETEQKIIFDIYNEIKAEIGQRVPTQA